MCLVAPADWPYGYYTLLRLVVTAASLCACLWLHRGGSQLFWPSCFGVLLYNPLIKVHLGRDIWTVVNLISCVFLLVVAYQLTKLHIEPPTGASSR